MKHLYALVERDGTISKTMKREDSWVNEVNAENLPFHWELVVQPKPNKKHVCSIRSLCETLPSVQHPKGQSPYCVCGKVYNDPIHLTNEQYDALTPMEKLFSGAQYMEVK